MILPAVIVMITFVYLPLLGNVIAFMDYVPFVPFLENEFTGLQNFERLFGDENFWLALGNTLMFTALNLVFYFPVPIALAIFVHSMLHPWIRSFLQSVLYLPHFLSWVIVVGFFQQTLGSAGILNQFLAQSGMDTVNLMQNPELFKFMIVAQTVWKDAGWGTIIFLAALSAIDDSLYESAAMDGAGVWRRLWHITLPGIRPIIILMLILRLGDALSVGFEQFLLQRDSVGPRAAEVLDTYVYFNGVVAGNWSIGVAAGLFKGVIGLVLILVANKVAHLLGEDGIYRNTAK
ncbi:MAG TPA: sugar ABC transporter permease [Candidatus Avipropionibacterium avicola]|uniref:Sugar ABC transporter permease n=1 Tax=Candidatus Avipropionibacterium avicola TaxID=2840701 RepID=A0A9D1H218_9ACTN|nr:sugar ABC transporter permease [Candidatus Avipropionibacterium avicola]